MRIFKGTARGKHSNADNMADNIGLLLSVCPFDTQNKPVKSPLHFTDA